MANEHDQDWEDAGTIAALMERFREQRLPRAERMLERVRAGEKLTDGDIQFLKSIYESGRQISQLVDRHPEYHKLVTRALDLYTEIIERGLENEDAG